MFFHKIISTGIGIGYMGKGAGTLAAIATCICWYYFIPILPDAEWTLPLIMLMLFFLGVWSATKVERDWGKDHQMVVIDEVMGMGLTLMFIPNEVEYIVMGLILFRFFDIVKPFFIARLEYLPGGWGVMADDVLAGLYSNLIMQIILYLRIIDA